MEQKLKKEIIKQLDFLIHVYTMAIKDNGAKEKARKHASKELEKIKNILKELETV